MRFMLKHKGYVGVFEFDEKTSLFLGKVSNSHHLVTFQGKSVESTKKAFKDAVDEYIEWSKKHSNVWEKPSLEV